MPLMRRFRDAGWRVVVATADDSYAPRLRAEGIEVEPIHFRRRGFNFREDLRSFFSLLSIYRRYKPDLIHHFHAKPVILGTIAAKLGFRMAPITVNTITGLGYAFSQSGRARLLAGFGYRAISNLASATIFQNNDDRDLFLSEGWLEPAKARLIRSSGVDCSRFSVSVPGPVKRIVMITRLLKQKGVPEFIEAARLARKVDPNLKFQLGGETDSQHPDSMPMGHIQRAEEEGVIDFLGYLPKVEDVLSGAYLFVFPSYYREGVPRIVLEAAACGVPAIVADSPGSRDSIVDGETGRMVVPRDAQALFGQIMEFVKHPELQRKMGSAARLRVSREFDIRAVTEKYLDVYRELGCSLPPTERDK